MVGNFDCMSDNLMSFAFYVGLSYAWMAFICKRLMMEGWND